MKKILLILLLCNSSAYCMSKVLAYSGKIVAKTAYIGVNSIPYLTAAYIVSKEAVATAHTADYVLDENQHEVAPEKVTSMVQQQAQIQGFKEANKIQVRILRDEKSPFSAITIPTSTDNKYFINCSPLGVELIEQIYKNPNAAEWVKFALRHEANHLVYHDSITGPVYFLCGVVPSSLVLYQAARSSLNSLPTVKRWLLPTLTPLIMPQYLNLVWAKISRMREQRADDAVKADKKMLASTHKMFSSLDQLDHYSLFRSHPTFKERADKIASRLKQLEK
jgi:hypothetical protein